MLGLAKNNTYPYRYYRIPANKTHAVSTEFVLRDIVHPGNGYFYICTVAGTSGGSAPTWPTTEGGTVVDGTATWQCVGLTTDLISIGITLTNAGGTLNSDTVSAQLVASSYKYTDITITVSNEQPGIDWKLSLNNVDWFDSLTPADMDALSANVVTPVYIRYVINNNSTVPTGVYSTPDINISSTENPV